MNKKIGSTVESGLLVEIINKLDRLIAVTAKINATTTTTTTTI